MSRLGKKPIEFSPGTQVKIEGDLILIKGPKGELKRIVPKNIAAKIDGNNIILEVVDPKIKKSNVLWGTWGSLIRSMIIGVEKGFERKLEISGVGYKVQLSGKKFIFNVGFSHPVEFVLPEGISGKVEENIITINGINKELVGQTAASIRGISEPEPYKGKGIKYLEEVVRRKETKTAIKSE